MKINRDLSALGPDHLKTLTPGETLTDPSRRTAAVTAIFLNAGQGTSLLFTKRAGSLGEHASQISFPGGAVEAGDSGPLDAALRETREEIGIESGELRIITALPCQPVLDTWLIHPFAAWWASPRPLRPEPAEIGRAHV